MWRSITGSGVLLSSHNPPAPPPHRAAPAPHMHNEVHVARSSRLSIEHLEERCVPATWGNPWPDAAHLTISFAPDGTPLGDGQASSLFQTMSEGAPSATWQRAILRAFQT